jgi:D-sedoheptulose 7-phosphate isomerase
MTNFELLARSNEFATMLNSTLCTNDRAEHIPIETAITQIMALFNDHHQLGGNIYAIGNGGSATVASHAVTDLVNVSRLRAFTLHESALLTCMANDFGYDQVFRRIVDTFIEKQDCLIAISSSGKSKNICDAVTKAKEAGAQVITFSGFYADNPLRKAGHFNFWLNSTDYGLIEIGHLFILHNLVDRDREAVAFKDAEKARVALS